MKPDEKYSPAGFAKKPILILKRGNFNSLARDIVAKGVPFRFKAEGYSMSPFIRHNDIVTIVPSFQVPIDTGDIVAFSQPGTDRLLVHRVIKKAGRGFLASGDNIAKHDGLVLSEHIIGLVKKIERHGRHIHLGLGPEKYVIAFMSRNGLLYPFLKIVRNVFSLLRKAEARWTK